MSAKERFPLNMQREVGLCISEFDKRIFSKFRSLHATIKKSDLFPQEINQHNKFIFEKINKTQVHRIIINGLLFLLPTSTLPVSQIYDLAIKLSTQPKITSGLLRAIKHIRQILSENHNTLNSFAALFNQNKISWIHFLILGPAFSHVDSLDTKKLVMSTFIHIAPELDKTHLNHMAPFISGIPPNLFFQFVRPYLDSNMLRNPGKIVAFLPLYILPLQFSIFALPKRTVTNFIESLSNLCISHDPKLAELCCETLASIAPKLSPNTIVLNSKSSVAMFASIEPSVAGLKIAFEQLSNRKLPHSTRGSAKTYIVKSINRYYENKISKNKKTQMFNNFLYFSVVDFIIDYLLPENDYSLIYSIIDFISETNSAEKEKIIKQITDNQQNLMAKTILIKLKLSDVKENELQPLFSAKSCQEMQKADILVLCDLCYRLKDSNPDFVCRSLNSLLSFSKFTEIIFSWLRKCINEFNADFNNSLFNYFKIRKPADLLKLDIPKNIIDQLTIPQKVLCFAAGYSILDDSPDICIGLFDITDSEWQKGVIKALSQIVMRPLSHKQCVIEIEKRKDKIFDDSTYAPVIANLFKTFDLETDRYLLEEIFHKCNYKVLDSLAIEILERIPRYRPSSTLLCSIFKTMASLSLNPREKIFFLFPQKYFTAFDFLFLLPFMSYLLSEKDYIAKTISKIIAQYSYIQIERAPLFQGMIQNGDDDAIAPFLIADQFNEFSDNEVAMEITRTKEIGQKAFELINKLSETTHSNDQSENVFKHSICISILTMYDLYCDLLPSFKDYLEKMIGYCLDHNVDTPPFIAKTLENYPPYKTQFKANIQHIIQNSNLFSNLACKIFASLTSYKDMGKEIAVCLFNMKPTDYDPQVFNKCIVPKITNAFPDFVIDHFLEKDDFKHINRQTVYCLENSLIYSQKLITNLIVMLEKYCSRDASDFTIQEMLKCYDILHETNKKDVEHHANHIIKSSNSQSVTLVAFNFHFAQIPNKNDILKNWMTGNDRDNNQKGLETFRYIFLNPDEKENANILIKELVKYCDSSSDDSIVEGANRALHSAASSLGKESLDILIVTIMQLMNPNLSRKSENVLIDILMTIGKRFPDLLLEHLDQFISSILSGNFRGLSMEPLLQLVEKSLLDSDYPPLLRYTFEALHKNSKPIEILNLINNHLEQVNEDQKICVTLFHLIENYLTLSDTNVKVSSFAILSELDLPDEEIGKAVDIFISVMNDMSRKQILPYFKKFINKISYDKKIHVYNELCKVGESLNAQSNGFSLLFGCLISQIYSQMRDMKTNGSIISELITLINSTKNECYRDALLSSIEQIYDQTQEDIIENYYSSLYNSSINKGHVINQNLNFVSPNFNAQNVLGIRSFPLRNASIQLTKEQNLYLTNEISQNDLFDTQIIPLSECIMNQSQYNPNLVLRLMVKMSEIVLETKVQSFVKLIIQHMNNEKSVVRDLCISILAALQKHKKLTIELITPEVYDIMAASIKILTNDKFIDNQKTIKLFTALDEATTQKLYYSEFPFEDYLGRFLKVPELLHITLQTVIEFCNNCNDIALMKWFILQWHDTCPTFDNQYNEFFHEKALSSYGRNISIIAINTANGTNIDVESDDDLDITIFLQDSYKPRICLSYDTIKNAVRVMLDFDSSNPQSANNNQEKEEKICGLALIFPFLLAYHKMCIKQRENIEFTAFDTVAKYLRLPPQRIHIPPRTMSPQVEFAQIRQTGTSVPNVSIPRSLSEFTSANQIQQTTPKNMQSELRNTLKKCFIKLGTLYSGREIVNYPINDKLVLDLLLSISSFNPTFFASSNVTNYFYSHFFTALFSIQMNEVSNIIQNILKKLTNMDDIACFIRYMTNFFITFKVNQNNRASTIIPNAIVSLIFDKFLENDWDYSYEAAMFFMAAFKFFKEDVIGNYSETIVNYFLIPLAKTPFDEPYNYFTTISLFLPYVKDIQNTGIAALSTCLNYLTSSNISARDLRCDLLTLVDTLLSSSIPLQLIIQILLQHMTDGSSSKYILQAIALSLKIPTISLPVPFLINVWKTVSKNLHTDLSAKKEVKCTIAEIGAEIINICGEDPCSIVVSLFLVQEIDLHILSSFASNLTKHDILDENFLKAAKKDLLSKENTIVMLPLIPIFVEFGIITQLERLTFLVRGLFSKGFAAPMMCYKELKQLAPEIRKLNIADASVILSGIYFASTSITNSQLSQYAREALINILSPRNPDDYEEAKAFFDNYMKTLDPSVAQALQKDISIL